MASDPALVRTADREMAAQEGNHLKLRLWLGVLTCMQLIETQIRPRLRAEFDTTLPRFDVLAQLDASCDGVGMGSLTMEELSVRLMVPSGSVTGLMDTMHSEHLVERLTHLADRHSTLISMTERGRSLFDRIAPAHAQWGEELMAGLSTPEAATLHRLVGKLKQSVSRPDAAETGENILGQGEA